MLSWLDYPEFPTLQRVGTTASLMGCTNPTIWRFIDVLRKEQVLTDWKIAQKLMRQPPPPRQKKWLDYDRRLNVVIDAYDDYERLDFLRCVESMSLNWIFCVWYMLITFYYYFNSTYERLQSCKMKLKIGQDLCRTTVHVVLEYRQRTVVRLG